MIVGGVAELFFGVNAERRGLEGIAKPLTAVESAVRSGRRAGRRGRRAGQVVRRQAPEAT